MRKALPRTAGLLLSLGLAGGLLRVASLEGDELDYESAPVLPADLAEVGPRHELARLSMRRGQAALFEVCARGGFDAAAFGGQPAFEIWSLDGPHLLRRTEVDAAQLGRAVPVGADARCMVIAHSEHLPTAGAHAVTLDWGEGPPPPALAELPLWVRVRALSPPVRLDGLVHIATLLGVVLLLAALFVRPASGEAGAPDFTSELAPLAVGELRRAESWEAWLRVGAAVATLFGAELVLAHLPFGGRAYAFVRGLLLAAVQLATALALVRPRPGQRPREALALTRPPRASLWIVVALACGVGLAWVATRIQAWLPAEAESHVASLVVFPSGLLAVRLVGAFAPLVEEVFFRGFIYGAIADASGRAPAFVVAVCAFAAVHVPQVAGDVGSFVAILTTGAVLTALRLASGSTLIPAVAHLLYNAIL